MSGLKPSSLGDFLRSMIASKEAIAAPRECPTNLNLNPCRSISFTMTAFLMGKKNKIKKPDVTVNCPLEKGRKELTFHHLVFL